MKKIKKEQERFTFRNYHKDKLEILTKYFSVKLDHQTEMSKNDCINYLIEKSFERLAPFLRATNGSD